MRKLILGRFGVLQDDLYFVIGFHRVEKKSAETQYSTGNIRLLITRRRFTSTWDPCCEVEIWVRHHSASLDFLGRRSGFDFVSGRTLKLHIVNFLILITKINSVMTNRTLKCAVLRRHENCGRNQDPPANRAAKAGSFHVSLDV